MPFGFAISLLLHLGLLGWGIASIRSTPRLDLPLTPTIEATMVTIAEVTRLKQGDPDAKVLEAKAADEPQPETSKQEADKPKPVTAPPPAGAPPPEPEPAPPEEAKPEPPPPEEKVAALPPPVPEPAPGPTPEELKKQEDERKAEEQRQAEEKKKAEEEKKAEEKKKAEDKKKKQAEQKKIADAKRKADEAKKNKFDPDRISALLDKTPEKRGARPAGESKTAENKGPTAGEREGKDSVLTAREQDMLIGLLKSQIAPCWRLPGGGGGTNMPVVALKWRMKPDGSLDGEPQVARSAAGAAGQIALEAAMRAVKTCQPFRLPAEVYSGWKEITWEFDPSRML